MKREFSAGVFVYRLNETEDLKYLILHCLNGQWDFSKGKLQAGESERQAALRELEEETGLVVPLDKDFAYKIFYKFRSKGGELVSKQVTFFIGMSSAADVTVSSEHSGYDWVSYQEARGKLTYENSVRLLDVAHAFITKTHHIG